jgi:hypothetical protein
VSSIIGEDVVVVRQPERDEDGNWVEPDAPRTTVHGAVIAPRSATETDDRAATGTLVGLTLYLPLGTVSVEQGLGALIDAADGIEVRGRLYEVDGEPGEWVSPWTGQRGLEVALRRGQGSGGS